MPLTGKRVLRLRKRPGRYLDDGGFTYTYSPGNASWILGTSVAGTNICWAWVRRTFSLKEARERARAARQQLADGIDPVVAKRTAKAQAAAVAARTLTFADATQYNEAHEAQWHNARHREQFLASMRICFSDDRPLTVSYIGIRGLRC